MLRSVLVYFFCLWISSCYCGKAAKRGNRHDSGKLVATLCHYYSDGAMGCKECFEVARSHRSNHNSTLLPPCKSVQGIKRRSWTLEDGIILNAIIERNATTKRVTLASCAFYSNNKTFTCVATRPQCDNLTEMECANNTSWSGRYNGSITEGFRCTAPPINGSKPAKHHNGTYATSSKFTTAWNTRSTGISSTSTTTKSSLSTTLSTTPLTSSSTPKSLSTMVLGQGSDAANEVHKISELTALTLAPNRELKSSTTPDLVVLSTGSTDHSSSSAVMIPQKSFTMTSLLTTQVQSTDSTGYSENCTETSCTIFADNPPLNNTAANLKNQTLVYFNETFVQESSHEDNSVDNPVADRNATRGGITTVTPTSQLVAVSGWSTNNPEIDAIFNQGGTNISTTKFKMVLLDEIITPNNGPQPSSTSGMTSTTTLVVFPTFSSNASSSKHPEPRKRQQIRRMY